MAKVDPIAKRINTVTDTVKALRNMAHQRRSLTIDERHTLLETVMDIELLVANEPEIHD